MAILKFETRTPRSLPEMYNYLVDCNKTDRDYILGIGVNPLHAVEEMLFVQRCFYKNNLEHPYVQVIFSFAPNEQPHLYTVKKVCEEIGHVLILDERQVFGAIHFKNTSNIHCHFLINYVNVKGELYRQNLPLTFYKEKVNEVLAKNVLPQSLIYYYKKYWVNYRKEGNCYGCSEKLLL